MNAMRKMAVVKAFRLKLCLTQLEYAHFLSVSRSAVTKHESNKRSFPCAGISRFITLAAIVEGTLVPEPQNRIEIIKPENKNPDNRMKKLKSRIPRMASQIKMNQVAIQNLLKQIAEADSVLDKINSYKFSSFPNMGEEQDMIQRIMQIKLSNITENGREKLIQMKITTAGLIAQLEEMKKIVKTSG